MLHCHPETKYQSPMEESTLHETEKSTNVRIKVSQPCLFDFHYTKRVLFYECIFPKSTINLTCDIHILKHLRHHIGARVGAMGLMSEESWFDSQQGQDICLFSQSSRLNIFVRKIDIANNIALSHAACSFQRFFN